MRKYLVFFCFSVFAAPVFAQPLKTFNPDTLISITLDSVINIRSTRISTQTFINQILRDTSFYEAFRNIKRYNFNAENTVYTFDKKNRIEGKLYRKIQRRAKGDKLKILVKQDSGKVYRKNGKYQLYTLQMFDYIFLGAYQGEYTEPGSTAAGRPGDKNQSYREKLKALLFSPGRPVKGVPFIGAKTEIFTPNMRQYYDYTFSSAVYLDSIPVYKFKVTEKRDLSAWTKDGIMIKELTTIFDKRNMQILGRYVDMKYDNLAFSFDVQMNIEMGYFDGGEVLLPTKVSYTGNWDVPFKSRERASFLLLHKGYSRAN